MTTLIVNNLTPAAVAESTQALVDEINKSQIALPKYWYLHTQ